MPRAVPSRTLLLAVWASAWSSGCGSVIEATDGDTARDDAQDAADADADAGPDADADGDVGPDADADADGDGDVSPPTGCHIDGTDHADGEIAPDNDCLWCRPEVNSAAWTPRPDFTRCTTSTDPERDYDICSGGLCVSPGCGTVACNAPGPNWPLPDTNQRACFDESTLMGACPGGPARTDCEIMTSFCGQDAQYGWDTAPGVTERFSRTVSAPQPVVRDTVSGLVWQGCPAGLDGAMCAGGSMNLLTWAAAVAWCEQLEWNDSDHWRLPNRYELQTLLDFGGEFFIDRVVFPGLSPVGATFWSSSSRSDGAAWAVQFARFASVDDNTITPRPPKTEQQAVRCVRNPAPEERAVRFERSEPHAGYPVVHDAATGLVWQGCAARRHGSACGTNILATMNWREALWHCESLSWAGFGDWRLPNANELTSLVDDRLLNPAIDAAVFPDTPNEPFWTSTTAGQPAEAWTVNFADGPLERTGKTSAAHVRCVRDGAAD